MRKITMTFILLCAFNLIVNAQEENIDRYMTAMVASDTILDGNSFEFKIIIRNLKGDFTPPVFENFDIVGGPNMSTSMQYINGSMFREMTYTYHLKAHSIGENYIEEAYLTIEDGDIETEAISIYVLDNPEQIQKEYRITRDSKSSFIFPYENVNESDEKTKKPKRKLKKI